MIKKHQITCVIRTHNSDSKFVPIFVPQRAPRNDATGIKQLNSAPLKTIVYTHVMLEINSHIF